MASTQSEQAENVNSAVEKPLTELPDADAEVYLAAMDHNSFTMIGLVQSIRIAVDHANQQHLKYKKAYEFLWQRTQILTQDNIALREAGEELNKRLHNAHSIAISFHQNSCEQYRFHEKLLSQLGDLQSRYEDLQSQAMELKSLQDEKQEHMGALTERVAELVEERQKMMQDLDAAARRAENAERQLQRRGRRTHNGVQGSPAASEGVATVANLIQGGVLTVENSIPSAGSESTPKKCGVGPEQGLISSDPDHSNRRSRLRRKGISTVKQLILDIPGKGT